MDDTKIYMSFNVKDCDDAVSAVNEDLHNIRNWCFQNGLLLNLWRSVADKIIPMVKTC